MAENQTLADLLRQKAQSVIDFPTTVTRNLFDPQAFLKQFGYSPNQQLSGFSAGYSGVPEQPPSDIGVLDSNNREYNKGYSSGEDAGLATGILGGTAALARPIAKPVGRALGEYAWNKTEKMMQQQGLMPSIMPRNNANINSDPFKIAQQNASLPILEGGLGLPKNNTAMDRAKAMGYETPVYHGTNADINAFNVEGKGKTSGAGAFFTTNPITAETYVSASGQGNILPLLIKQDDFLTTNAKGRNWADIYTNELSAKSGKNRYTLEELGLDRNSATTTDELGMVASDMGKKGIQIKNVKDLGINSHVMRAKEYLNKKYGIVPDETWSNVTGKQFDEAQKAMKKFYDSQKSDVYAINEPSLIRSRFAAFDPKRVSEANILAGGLAIPTSELTRREVIEQQFNK